MDILHLSREEVNKLRSTMDFYEALNYSWITYNLRRPDLLYKGVEDGKKKDTYEFVSEFDIKDGDIPGPTTS